MLRYFTATLTFPSERSASKARPSNQLSSRSGFGSPLPPIKRGGNSSVASKPFGKLRRCVPFHVTDHPHAPLMTLLTPPDDASVYYQILTKSAILPMPT